MHPLPRRTLRRLLAQYGPALLDEPARVDALLADLCGPYHCERFLLIHALRERISVANWPVALWLGSCSQRLQKRFCFSAESAAWAVESWSFALGIASTVAETSPYTSPAKLSEVPQRALCRLLTDWGPDLLDDPGRVDALLADLCGPFTRERFLLFHALRERIPTQLVLAHALREHIPAQLLLTHAPREHALAAHLIHPHGNAIHANWISQHLQNRYGFSAEAALWAVEGCSIAVHIASPVQALATAGKPLAFLDEIMLRIQRHDPRAKAWVSTEALARWKAKEHDEAVSAARQKAEEREAAEEAIRQKAKRQNEAVAVARQKAEEREEADEAVRLKANEQKDAVALARQKAEEREAAEKAVRQKASEQEDAVVVVGQKAEERKAAEKAVHQKAEERHAEKTESLKRASETIAAQETALTKAKEWMATEAADHQMAKEWDAAEETVLLKAEEWVETKVAEHQKIAGWSGARAAERQKTEELAAAEAVVLRKTEEWAETKAEEHQKTGEWVTAEAVILQKIKEWVAVKEAARKKMFEWAAAEKAARVKAEELAAAKRAAHVMTKEQAAAEKAAHVMAEEQAAVKKAARVMALEEITLLILNETPMTSREVAAFLDREHEQAVSWLRKLQAAGKVEYTWLKRSPHHPCYKSKEQSNSWSSKREIDLQTGAGAAAESYL